MVLVRASGPADVHSLPMSRGKPNARLRGAVEAGLRVAGPGLDLLLTAGDRLSRVLARGDQGYAIVRLEHEGESAPRGLNSYQIPRVDRTP